MANWLIQKNEKSVSFPFSFNTQIYLIRNYQRLAEWQVWNPFFLIKLNLKVPSCQIDLHESGESGTIR